MKMMTKAQFYNAAVNVRKETGQGLSASIFKMSPFYEECVALVDEFVAEGKMKKITQHYGTLPDDEWWVLTDGFCVEESYNDDTKGHDLDFIRTFLNHEDEYLGTGKTVKQLVLESEELKPKYDQWLIDNKEALDIMVNTPLMDEDG